MVWGQEVLEAGLSLTAALEFGAGVCVWGGVAPENRVEVRKEGKQESLLLLRSLTHFLGLQP